MPNSSGKPAGRDPCGFFCYAATSCNGRFISHVSASTFAIKDRAELPNLQPSGCHLFIDLALGHAVEVTKLGHPIRLFLVCSVHEQYSVILGGRSSIEVYMERIMNAMAGIVSPQISMNRSNHELLQIVKINLGKNIFPRNLFLSIHHETCPKAVFTDRNLKLDHDPTRIGINSKSFLSRECDLVGRNQTGGFHVFPPAVETLPRNGASGNFIPGAEPLEKCGAR